MSLVPPVPSQPPIRIDLDTERLWRGSEALLLRPKTWAVLRYLVDRPGALATKEELLDAVWADAVVSEGTLNKSIGELRSAFGDERERPRFIETVPRRGFRWIAGAGVTIGRSPTDRLDPAARAPASTGQPSADSLVGRASEIAALDSCLDRALAGNRQVVFLSGEAGAGKSTLVEAFLARLHATRPEVLSAYGQCIEAYGQHEPYRPLLEATERLAARADHGPQVQEILRSCAPTWLRQMPSLASTAPAASEDAGMAPARMVREIAAALEEISLKRPLVLVVEDAHWADLATTDACNLIARRRDRAHLLVLVTLRTADALVARHPVLEAKTDLVTRGAATEIPIGLFSATVVEDYLRERCDGLPVDPELAAWIHRQTAGNPLFVRVLVDDLIARAVLVKDAGGCWQLAQSLNVLRETIPDNLRELVERQVDRLAPVERAVVEAASVLRPEFTTSFVAAVAGIPDEQAEDACIDLARRGQILKQAAHSIGTRSERFSFVHAMVQRTLHERLPASRKRRLHLAAAEHLERQHAGREDSVALQLALHCAIAGDQVRALAQLQRAAASVQQIPAPREVIVIREQILDLVQQSPDLPGHRRELIVALMELAEARQRAFAVVDAETTALCERVVELSVSLEDGRECFLASMGLFSSRFYTGRYEEAREIGQRLLLAAQVFQHPFMIKSAHFAIAGATYRLGNLDEAQAHFESCLEHFADSQQTYGWDFHLMSLSHLALVAIHRGKPDEARRLIREAEAHGSRGGTTPDAAVIPLFAYALAILGDDEEAMARVVRALAQSDRLGAAAWIERARFVHGLLLSRQGRVQEGIGLMKESLARQARNTLYIDRSAYCALLAEEMLRRGVAGARAVVDDGISCMQRTNERHFEAELQRLREALPA